MNNDKCCVLKDVRIFMGLSQQGLADRVGVSRNTISAIERGSSSCDVWLACRIAADLGCRVDNIWPLECCYCHKKNVLKCKGKKE